MDKLTDETVAVSEWIRLPAASVRALRPAWDAARRTDWVRALDASSFGSHEPDEAS